VGFVSNWDREVRPEDIQELDPEFRARESTVPFLDTGEPAPRQVGPRSPLRGRISTRHQHAHGSRTNEVLHLRWIILTRSIDAAPTSITKQAHRPFAHGPALTLARALLKERLAGVCSSFQVHLHREGGSKRLMKMVMAILQPSRLEAVKSQLTQEGVTGLTVTDARGVGRQQGRTEIYRGHEYTVDLIPKVKIEVAVDDDAVDKVVLAIAKAAKSGPEGKIGDGKIFVYALDEVVRIRTGETGTQAL
jgi:nitrogen regulatory protein PII